MGMGKQCPAVTSRFLNFSISYWLPCTWGIRIIYWMVKKKKPGTKGQPQTKPLIIYIHQDFLEMVRSLRLTFICSKIGRVDVELSGCMPVQCWPEGLCPLGNCKRDVTPVLSYVSSAITHWYGSDRSLTNHEYYLGSMLHTHTGLDVTIHIMHLDFSLYCQDKSHFV